jgi:TonB family protein
VGHRRYFAAAAAAGLFMVFALGETSAQPGPDPTPPACAHPNVPPATLREAQPHFPDNARSVGVGGNVTVDVTLDEASNITAVAVEQSPSRVLNAAALEAARNSVFRTEVRDCRAVKGTYRFIVTFDPRRPDPMSKPEPPEPSAVFAGSADAPILSVVALGTASRAPDIATIRVAMSSLGADAETANAADRNAYADFERALYKIGITESPVNEQTVNVASLRPSGYMVTRLLAFRASVGTQTGQALVAAAAAGVEFASVQYAVSNDNSLYAGALADAERSADLSARTSAASRSLTVRSRTGVTLAAYREHALAPVQTVHLVRDGSPAVPDPPATLEARTAVTVTYALRP